MKLIYIKKNFITRKFEVSEGGGLFK